MTDVKRDPAADSIALPWTMVRIDYWSLVASAFVLLVALTGGAGVLDGDRLVNAARAAMEAQVGIAHSPESDRALLHRPGPVKG